MSPKETNTCAWCKEKIDGAYGYDPKSDNKFHFPCWVNYRKEVYEKTSFSPTLYPDSRP